MLVNSSFGVTIDDMTGGRDSFNRRGGGDVNVEGVDSAVGTERDDGCEFNGGTEVESTA